MSSQRGEYRVGLVGFRGRGRALARYWQGVERAQLVAVADLIAEHLEDAGKEFPNIRTYPDHASMLEKADLDVVTIGTAPKFRPPIVRDAANGGVKGIYMEKPMANSLAEADAMIEQCRAGGTVLTIGHQIRWTDHFRWARDAIRNGAIGRPTHGYVYWPAARIFYYGTHFLDALTFALDSVPVEVAGAVQYGLDREKTEAPSHGWSNAMAIDPGVSGYIAYANGARIAVDAKNDVLLPFAYMFCGTRGRIELIWDGMGEKADLTIDYRARDNDTRSLKDRAPVIRREPPNLPPFAFEGGVAVGGGYRELLDCIETGGRSSSSGEDGRLALEVIIAFHLSSAGGAKPVSLPLPDSALGYTIKHQGE